MYPLSQGGLLQAGTVASMEPISKSAGPLPYAYHNEVMNTEVNLNHIGNDTFRIDSLKEAYLAPYVKSII